MNSENSSLPSQPAGEASSQELLKIPNAGLNVSQECTAQCESHPAPWNLSVLSAPRDILSRCFDILSRWFFSPKMHQSHTSAPVLEKDFSSSSGGCDHPSMFLLTKSPGWIHCPNSGNFQAACSGCTDTIFHSYSNSYNILVSYSFFFFKFYFILTEEWALALLSAGEWSSTHIPNFTSTDGAWHRGMRLRSPFHKAKKSMVKAAGMQGITERDNQEEK